MIGLKDQCFGVEVEMTGITREQAATALAAYFATDARYVGGAYDKWCVTDQDGVDGHERLQHPRGAEDRQRLSCNG